MLNRYDQKHFVFDTAAEAHAADHGGRAPTRPEGERGQSAGGASRRDGGGGAAEGRRGAESASGVGGTGERVEGAERTTRQRAADEQGTATQS